MAKTKSPMKADLPTPAAPADQAPALQLEYLEIKDVEDARLRLLETLDGGAPVRIGVGRVSTVDTAGVQLLLAFKAEAAKRGVAVEFHGDSAPLRSALAILGLGEHFKVVSAT
jgi:ABC-type transporter Mla MlaB component